MPEQTTLQIGPAAGQGHNERGIGRYLCSHSGIGPRRAQWLLDTYGPEHLFELIDSDPLAVFRSIPGLGEGAALTLLREWSEAEPTRELHALLAGAGLDRFAGELVARIGPDAAREVKAHPYRLTVLPGIGFQRADALARSLGVAERDPERAHAAIHHVLGEAEQHGHSYLPGEKALRRTRELLGCEVALSEISSAEGIVVEADGLYRRPTHAHERSLASGLRELASSPPAFTRPTRPAEHGKLTESQLAAVEAAFAARLSLVTGGPGTGKTHVISAIAEIARSRELRVQLCAPSGRAARRITDTSGLRAHTIHALIEWNGVQEPARGQGNPLEADLVIVDEASMLPLALARRLVDAIGSGAHLVLIGDVDQLPPIGPGRPFADLIESGIAPITRLGRIFRQLGDSMITENAHRIRRGYRPREPMRGRNERADFFVHTGEDAGRLQAAIVRLVSERIPRRFGFDPIEGIQVLSPQYRGALGVEALNERLRAALTPAGAPCVGGRFRIGDKVMVTRNRNELGLANGMLLYVECADDDRAELVLRTETGGRISLPYREAGLLRFGFCASVHKAQGIEVPAVVVCCHSSHAPMLLNRRLLYTAVTRAQRLCVLVGNWKGIMRAVGSADGSRRFSLLRERLEEVGRAEAA